MARGNFTPDPVHVPTPNVPAAGDVLKVVHYKDLLKCNHGGTVDLDPTVDRDTEIKDDYRIVTNDDLLNHVTISGCSRRCTRITAITVGLSENLELKDATIPVLRNLQATTDRGCIVTWKGFEFDVNAAASWADNHADGTQNYHGWCGRYVQNALREGLNMSMDGANAADMGPLLTSHGFTEVASGRGSQGFASPQKGDVVVFDGVPGHGNGHTAIWDGTQWVSDTKQTGFLAARAYANGTFRIYRGPGNQAHAKPQ